MLILSAKYSIGNYCNHTFCYQFSSSVKSVDVDKLRSLRNCSPPLVLYCHRSIRTPMKKKQQPNTYNSNSLECKRSQCSPIEQKKFQLFLGILRWFVHPFPLLICQPPHHVTYEITLFVYTQRVKAFVPLCQRKANGREGKCVCYLLEYGAIKRRAMLIHYPIDC